MHLEINHVLVESDIAEHQGMVPVELTEDASKLFTSYVPVGEKRKKVYIFETSTGEQLAELATGMEACTALRLAPDASGVVMEGSSHKYVSADGGEASSVRKTGDASCFSPDGGVVCTGDGESMYRWSVEEQSALGSTKHGRSEIDDIQRADGAVIAARVDASFNSEIQDFDYDGEFVRIDASSGDVDVLDGLPTISKAPSFDVYGDRIAVRQKGDYVVRAFGLDGELRGEGCRSLPIDDNPRVHDKGSHIDQRRSFGGQAREDICSGRVRRVHYVSAASEAVGSRRERDGPRIALDDRLVRGHG